ncbi:MAG: GNAT family N-acetyltransferase [Clostridium sp.]|uniref:GNAT family N-acetyltransferase n=1 Tax=Clostridium sp. TaxID=1506 RepID=UPI0030543298
MEIRLGEKKDYLQLAEMKWLHMEDDDISYNEDNLKGVDKESFIYDFVSFLESDNNYKIFIAEDKDVIISAMYLCIIPKLPKPNRNSESIAYLTSVYTRKDYRNQNVGTKLITCIKEYAYEKKCELLFVWPSEKSVDWYSRNGFSSKNEIMECILRDE